MNLAAMFAASGPNLKLKKFMTSTMNAPAHQVSQAASRGLPVLELPHITVPQALAPTQRADIIACT